MSLATTAAVVGIAAGASTLLNSGDGGGGGVTTPATDPAALKMAEIAEKQWQYFESSFKPYEEKLLKQGQDNYLSKVGTYDTPEKQAEAAAIAHADTTQAFGRARDANRRTMAAYGVNPGSGRFANMNLTSNLAEAKADAVAQNLARKGIRDEAFNKDVTSTNVALNIGGMGRNLPASAQTGLQGSAALNGAAQARNFAQSQIVADQQRQGLAPIASFLQKGVKNWFDAPSTSAPLIQSGTTYGDQYSLVDPAYG